MKGCFPGIDFQQVEFGVIQFNNDISLRSKKGTRSWEATSTVC